MGHQIIQQPNGLFAVFSTVADGFVVVDGTQEEIVEWYAEGAADKARRHAQEAIDQLLGKSDRPVLRTGITWEEADRRDRKNYPEKGKSE